MSSFGQPLNFNATDPAAPAGAINLTFQADAPTEPPTSVVRGVSVYAAFAYDTLIYFPTTQSSASQEIFRENVRHTKNYPANFSGTIAGLSCISGGSCKTPATGAGSPAAGPVFTIYQNGSAVGTITWEMGASTPTLATTGGAALTFNVGDIVTIVGPATPDPALSNWSVTLVSTRSS
jgi:hypothetical protein